MAHMTADINKLCAGKLVGTITITGMRRFNARCALAVALVRLAAWVAPARIDVEDERV